MTDPIAAVATTADQKVAALQSRVDELEAKLKAEVEKPFVAIRAWRATWNASACVARLVRDFYFVLNGLKTLIFFGATAGLGLLQEANTIDVSPILSKITPANAKIDVAGAVTLMAIAAILLRLITNSSAFKKFRKTTGGGSDSTVDEPAA